MLIWVNVVSVKDIRPDACGNKPGVYLFKDKNKAIAHIRDVEVAELFPNYQGEIEYDDVKMLNGFKQGKGYVCGDTMFTLEYLPIE